MSQTHYHFLRQIFLHEPKCSNKEKKKSVENEKDPQIHDAAHNSN